jgi:membrane protein implicated in regulation of membrane protease activity
MDWSPATWWWIVAGALVAAELVTGTFYLLMIALGCAAGALAAYSGLGLAGQIIVGAVVGSAATALWHFKRAKQAQSAPVELNRDVNLDIGSIVQVTAWQSDGTARVQYRGAGWAARYEGPGSPQAGEHVIVAMRGSQLGLAPAPSRQ